MITIPMDMAETIRTLFVAVLLGFTALELGIYALGSLGQEQSPEWIAIYVAVISIFIKEILFWLTMRIGKKRAEPSPTAQCVSS